MKLLPLMLLGAGAAVGGGVLLYRRAAAADPVYAAGLRCKAARTIAAIYGREISDKQCELADAVDDKIGVGAFVNWLSTAGKPSTARADALRSRDANNKKLNGEVAIPLGDDVRVLASQVDESGNIDPLLTGSVLRFQNGGVPFAAHPDFSKCVPGTADMTSPGNAADRFWNIGAKPFTAAQTLRDRLKDTPKTNVAAWEKLGISWANTPHIGELLRGSYRDPSTSIRLGIVAGLKHECPPGQVLIDAIPVTDHRGAGTAEAARAIIKRCGPPGTAPGVTAPSGASSGTQTGYVAPPGAPPPGFHWVQAAVVGGVTVPAHWERIR